MKKYFFSIFALFTIITTANSQAAKSIYFELGGPGLASINFDSRLSPKEDGIGIRVGVGGFSLSTQLSNGTTTTNEHASVVFIPLGLNYLLGKDGKNYFEIGGGVSPVFASATFSDENFSSTFGFVTFGYRMQPKAGGFTFRAFVCPIFGQFGFIPYYGGISFGYKFGNKKEKN
ncbi:MAG: hypothetical protein JJE22_04470 [Bacteroidia bacterium]|nr:hypothetical protein [Bacteroidia bacterium]